MAVCPKVSHAGMRSLAQTKLKMSGLVSSTENQATEDKANMIIYTSVKEGGALNDCSKEPTGNHSEA